MLASPRATTVTTKSTISISSSMDAQLKRLSLNIVSYVQQTHQLSVNLKATVDITSI